MCDVGFPAVLAEDGWNAVTTRGRPLHRDNAEAAGLIDAIALPLAFVLDPGPLIETGRFRHAVLCLAIAHKGASVAGILFAARRGGGVMLT